MNEEKKKKKKIETSEYGYDLCDLMEYINDDWR